MPALRLALLLLLLCLAPFASPAQAQAIPAGAPAAEAAPAPDVDETMRLLAATLEDPAARAALVERLRGAGAASSEAPSAEEEVSDGSIARAVADRTRAVAERLSALAVGLVAGVADWRGHLDDLRALDWTRIADVALKVGVIVVATLSAFLLLRRATRGPRRRMAMAAPGTGLPHRVLGLLVSALFDVALIALAWGAGHALALALGDGGRIDIRQSLFLNAFVLVEAAKLALRILLSPNLRALRLWPMSDPVARDWYGSGAAILAVLGYGLMLGVPVARTAVSAGFAEALTFGVVIFAAIMAMRLILRERVPVREAMRARAGRKPEGVVSGVLVFLAQTWHLVALAYVAALVLVWWSRPADSLGFMMAATLRSALAVLAGTLAMILLSRAMSRGVRLPDTTRARLPMLETRLNALAPNLLNALRIVVLIVILGLVAETWGVFDFRGWLSGDAGVAVVQAALSAALILLFAGLVWLAVSSWIEYKLNPTGGRIVTARTGTLLSLLRNAFTVVVVVMTAMLTLSAIGVNIAPLLAGAGVVGLAVGFGAQKLVQDIITGAFIQFENAMNAGDVVSAGGISGVVEKLTIRSVGLRDVSGTYHLIPFSSVDVVSNMMKDFAYHVADIGVAYREDTTQVKALMEEAFQELRAGELGAGIIGPLDMQGVTQLGDSAVTVRARIKTLPGKQWAIGRAFSEIVKRRFDAAGVEMPFPHMTLYFGEDKDGGAPPLRLARAPQLRDGGGGGDGGNGAIRLGPPAGRAVQG